MPDTSPLSPPELLPDGEPARARARTPTRPRVPSRKAWLTVWTFGLAFAAGSLAGTFLVDSCPLELRAPETEPIFRVARAMPRRPDVAAFGSSRFGGSVVPERVSARLAGAGVPGALVLNASIPAGEPVAFDVLLERLAAEGRAPRVAVVELSPESVGRGSPWLRGSLVRFLTWRSILKLRPTDIVTAQLQTFLAESRLIPFFKHRSELLAWLERGTCFSRLNGTAPRRAAPVAGPVSPAPPPPAPAPPARPSTEPAAPPRRGIERMFRNYEPGGLPAEALRRFLARARATETTVVLLGVPVSSHHRAAYTPAVEAAYRSFLDGIVREAGVTYVERRDLLADTDFIDGHHVSPAGAERFSDYFATGLVAPLLRPTADGGAR